jgi:hypothetical protein
MMDEYTVKRMGLILAVQAEIEGMKAANLVSDLQEYGGGHFDEKAEEIRNIVNANDHQLDLMG